MAKTRIPNTTEEFADWASRTRKSTDEILHIGSYVIANVCVDAVNRRNRGLTDLIDVGKVSEVIGDSVSKIEEVVEVIVRECHGRFAAADEKLRIAADRDARAHSRGRKKS